jgi:gliding motility-associated-like protein
MSLARFREFVIICLFMMWAGAACAQTCSLRASTLKGCVPTADTLQLTLSGSYASLKISSYTWTFADGTNSSQASLTVVHIYYKRGAYRPSVKVSFTNGASCTATLGTSIRIFDNPIPYFNLPVDTILLCDTGVKYCFKDASHAGQDKAPLKKWLWDFRDGNPFDTVKNPCHAFPYSYIFKTTLRVIDTNACSALFVKDVAVRILPPHLTPKPDFTDSISQSCIIPEAKVTFINKTDTVGRFITRFIWDYDDGTRDTCYLNKASCKGRWSNFIHKYNKAGKYCPVLTISTKYNCGDDSFRIRQCIDVKVFRPEPKVLDTAECFPYNLVRFSANFDPKATYQWNFGDLKSRDNVVTGTYSVTHPYVRPGTNTIYFSSSYGACTFDTVFCRKVKIYGPVARIQLDTSLDRIPFDSLKYIPPSQYPQFFDTCHSPVHYTLRDSLFIPNGDTTFGSYCKATIKEGYDSNFVAYNCLKKEIYDSFAIYSRPILGTKGLYKIKYKNDSLWYKGEPYPKTGKVYKGVYFRNRPLVWDDTDIFSPHCGPPKLIHFTNFSIKYRGHEAGDNFPPGSNDKCRLDFNPSWPYASDSLLYHWDFGEGKLDTSTALKPDRRSKYSTEKLPWHLFLDTGCFIVELKVQDPVTGCRDSVQMSIVLQKPSAKWDAAYDTVKRMDYNKQLELGKTFALRRGFLLEGKPCAKTDQYINMSETLPLCLKREYALVLDSLSGTHRDTCGGKTELVHDWAIDPYGNIQYNDSGWKSIGVAITSNPYCYDTFWYHNYKYIFKLFPQLIPASYKGCPDTKFIFRLAHPEQNGIRLLTVNYKYAFGQDTLIDLGTDTFRYKIIINNLGNPDTVTSTTANPLFPIVDTAHFTYLYDSVKKVFGRPGHFYVRSTITNRFGCMDTSVLDLAIGHYAQLAFSKQKVCVGDTVKFLPTVRYNIPSRYDSLILNKLKGYDFKPWWSDPIGLRHGRKPKYPERIKWDLDGDGTIDDSTHYQPAFVYTKPGNYTVKLYTKDSLNCKWQVLEKNVAIEVISLQAGFTIAPPGPDRFCNPQIFTFKSTSFLVDSPLAGRKKQKIALYVWNFGDGKPPIITTKDSIGYIITHNGTYTVTLTVFSSDSFGSGHKGCSATFSKDVHLEGPNPKFKIIGDTAGCVPFTLKVVDLSQKTSFKDWRLGDGTIVSTTTQDTVLLTYNRVGVFCPRIIGASQVTDSNNVVHFCSDTFPFKNCQFQVRVLPHPKVGLLLSDSIVCVNDPFTLNDKSDTAFKSWKISYGDGKSESLSKKPSLSYSYPNIGNYTIRYSGFGPYCPDSLKKSIKVVDVKAGFEIDTSVIDTPSFHFINTSGNADEYTWIFDDGTAPLTLFNKEGVTHKYETTGSFRICLVARNYHGCSDSVCKELFLDKYIFIPNVFTPGNNDGFNDRYIIVARGENLYHLDIFNRWGQKVFKSDNKNYTWDGSLFNDGHTQCASGAYYFLFHYRLLGEKEKTVEGTVTLIR